MKAALKGNIVVAEGVSRMPKGAVVATLMTKQKSIVVLTLVQSGPQANEERFIISPQTSVVMGRYLRAKPCAAENRFLKRVISHLMRVVVQKVLGLFIKRKTKIVAKLLAVLVLVVPRYIPQQAKSAAE